MSTQVDVLGSQYLSSSSVWLLAACHLWFSSFYKASFGRLVVNQKEGNSIKPKTVGWRIKTDRRESSWVTIWEEDILIPYVVKSTVKDL